MGSSGEGDLGVGVKQQSEAWSFRREADPGQDVGPTPRKNNQGQERAWGVSG